MSFFKTLALAGAFIVGTYAIDAHAENHGEGKAGGGFHELTFGCDRDQSKCGRIACKFYKGCLNEPSNSVTLCKESSKAVKTDCESVLGEGA